MFAIYDIDGRRFRDTLENLRKVNKIQTENGTIFQTDVSQDETLPTSKNNYSSNEDFGVSGKAIAAYREMRKLNQREPIVHAYQLMKHPVRTITADINILDAQTQFQKYGIQQMPVLSDQQRLIGMLSANDLLQYFLIDGNQTRYISGKRVRDAMSNEVITADPVSDIRRIAQVMQEYHLNAIPVANDHDALIGIISRGDILRAVMNDPPLNMWS